MSGTRVFQCSRTGWLVIFAIAGLAATHSAAAGAERGFPFDRELLLDTKPMRGSKRVPGISIEPNGKVAIDLWCNSVEGRFVVADDTITVLTGAKTDRQCDPARIRGDDELLAALLEATSWSKAGDVLTLRGGKTLRFRLLTN